MKTLLFCLLLIIGTNANPNLDQQSKNSNIEYTALQQNNQRNVIKNFINATIHKAVAAIPETVTLLPLNLRFNSPRTLSGKLSLSQLEVSGLKKIQIKSLDVNPIGNRFSIIAALPNINIYTKLNSTIHLAYLLPLFSQNAETNIKISDIVIRGVGKTNFNARRAVSFSKLKLYLSLGNSTVSIQGPLDNAGDSLTYSFWSKRLATAIKQHKERISRIISPIVQFLINNLLSGDNCIESASTGIGSTTTETTSTATTTKLTSTTAKPTRPTTSTTTRSTTARPTTSTTTRSTTPASTAPRSTTPVSTTLRSTPTTSKTAAISTIAKFNHPVITYARYTGPISRVLGNQPIPASTTPKPVNTTSTINTRTLPSLVLNNQPIPASTTSKPVTTTSTINSWTVPSLVLNSQPITASTTPKPVTVTSTINRWTIPSWVLNNQPIPAWTTPKPVTTTPTINRWTIPSWVLNNQPIPASTTPKPVTTTSTITRWTLPSWIIRNLTIRASTTPRSVTRNQVLYHHHRSSSGLTDQLKDILKEIIDSIDNFIA